MDQRPIYRRIAKELRTSIQRGDVAVGEQLPTEEALCSRYGVARATVRQALRELTLNGFIVRRRGRGTFVASDKAERWSNPLTGFLEDAQAHGLDPSVRLVGRGWETADKQDALLLDLNGQQDLYAVRRLRLAGDEPVGLNLILLVPELEPFFRGADFAASFYGLVRERLGVPVDLAQQRVEAVAADEPLRDLLELQDGASLLKITRVTFLDDGRRVGLTRTYYRGDRFYLSLTTAREPGSKGGDA